MQSAIVIKKGKMTQKKDNGLKVTERKMGADEQEMLKQAEKMMDDGVMPYVILEGKRIMFSQESLDHFNLKSGDAIDMSKMGELQKFQMSMFHKSP